MAAAPTDRVATLNTITPIIIAGWCWVGLLTVWFISALFTNRSRYKENPLKRLLPTLPLAFAIYITFGYRHHPFIHVTLYSTGWANPMMYPAILTTIAGCAFAIWARIILGSNWSGRATVKAGHELIVRGPYAVARHPIYTGLLLASIGTALAMAEWRCILGLALIVIVFAAKISQEEKLMLQTFPEAYPRYRQRVKALFPGLL